MKLRPIPYLLILFLAGAELFSSCKTFLEPDITGRKVSLMAPGDQYKSSSYAINFWWDEVEDALQYHLQVVSPKFDSIGGLALDTIVKSNKFSINLSPGKYQWRIRAENGSSKSAYSAPFTFTVLQSSIKQQKVQLISPGTNYLTNQSAVAFQWGDLYGATKYRLEIDTNNFVNDTVMVYNQVTPGQQISFSFLKDKTYQWRVRAENDTAQAQWSSINLITYDHVPPARVTVNTPANNGSVSLPVALQWSAVPTATKYKLFVFKSDSTTLYNTTFPVSLTTTSYNFNLGGIGDRILWKVSAIDAAGNESTPSVIRSFAVQ